MTQFSFSIELSFKNRRNIAKTGKKWKQEKTYSRFTSHLLHCLRSKTNITCFSVIHFCAFWSSSRACCSSSPTINSLFSYCCLFYWKSWSKWTNNESWIKTENKKRKKKERKSFDSCALNSQWLRYQQIVLLFDGIYCILAFVTIIKIYFILYENGMYLYICISEMQQYRPIFIHPVFPLYTVELFLFCITIQVGLVVDLFVLFEIISCHFAI